MTKCVLKWYHNHIPYIGWYRDFGVHSSMYVLCHQIFFILPIIILGSGQAKTIAIQPPMWFSKGEATPKVVWTFGMVNGFCVLPRWISSHQWSRSWSYEALEITGEEIWNGTPILHVSLVFISLDLGWSRYKSQFCCVFFSYCVAWWFLHPCDLLQIYLHWFSANSKFETHSVWYQFSICFGGSYFLEWSAAC